MNKNREKVMRFVKENPALAAGIGLPVLLIIFFTLATVIPQWTVEPPKYDAVFTVQDYQCIGGEAKANFDFSGGKIKAKYIYPKKENNYVNCSENQRIYHFNSKHLTSREITFELPAKKDGFHDWQQFEIVELQNLKIDNNPIAPDGYRFSGRDGYYSGGIFPFGGYHSYNGMSINKNGRAIDLSPINREGYYSYNNVKFLGWVVSESEGDKK
ncbi:MAG: hypothetical protein AABY33_00610 [Pseudomonadota bacterium]